MKKIQNQLNKTAIDQLVKNSISKSSKH